MSSSSLPPSPPSTSTYTLTEGAPLSTKQSYSIERIFPAKSILKSIRPSLPPRSCSSSVPTIPNSSSNHQRSQSSPQAISGTSKVQLSTPSSTFPFSAKEENNLGKKRRKFTSEIVRDSGVSEKYWKIGGREGEVEVEEEIEREEEVIAPGRIQSYGVLLVIELGEGEEGDLKVLQVSENSTAMIALSPSTLFNFTCFTRHLTADSIDNLRGALENLSDEEEYEIQTLGEESRNERLSPHRHFILEGFGEDLISDNGTRPAWKVHATLHRHTAGIEGEDNIYLLELELFDDTITPITTIDFVEAVQGEKTSGRSLKRKKGKGREAGMEIVSLLTRVEEKMTGAKVLEEFYQVTVETISELTGFERVIMQSFDLDGNALVVAEHSTKAEPKYKGLTFPSTDPHSFYDKVEVIYDVSAHFSTMTCRSEEEVNRVVDMRLCSLRSVERSKVKYLRALDIVSTTTLSLTTFSSPWGNITLQSSSAPQRPSISTRQILRLLLESINRHLERFSYNRRLNSRKLINPANVKEIGGGNFGNNEKRRKDGGSSSSANGSGWKGHSVSAPNSSLPLVFEGSESLGEVKEEVNIESPKAEAQTGISDRIGLEEVEGGGYIVTAPDDLLLLFDSDFACLSVGEEVQIFGKVNNTQDLFGAVEYFRYSADEVIESSRQISVDFPDLSYPGVAGILFLPLGEDRLDFILFFRLAEKTSIKWAGDPGQKNRLNFQPFEVIETRCRPWLEEELETSAVLVTVYGRFLDIWREKQSALAANKVTALLLSNTSHEIRTPLNAIVNYLEMALDSELEGETRKVIKRSFDSSVAVRNLVNDLVDLARTPQREEEAFNLSSTLMEALSGSRAGALRKSIQFDIDEIPQGTPILLLGDRVKLRKIISTIAANAVKHTSSGSIKVEYGVLANNSLLEGVDILFEKDVGFKKDEIKICITLTDTGTGISDAVLSRTFENFEKALSVQDGQRIVTAGDGLDLSVVARIVSSLGGELKIKSEVNKGSEVTLIVPFRLPQAGSTPSLGTHQLSDAF